MNKKIYIIAAVGFFIISGILYCIISEVLKKDSTGEQVIINGNQTSLEISNVDETEEADETEASDMFQVHICGAVNEPGVYNFIEGARIIDGIEAAGGFLETAAKGYLNLAAKMSDELKVYVPTEDEVNEGGFQAEAGMLTKTDDTGRININHASKDKLIELPGIGAKKAESIIKYREDKGLFKSIEELLNVDGIGESLYNSIAESITI